VVLLLAAGLIAGCGASDGGDQSATADKPATSAAADKGGSNDRSAAAADKATGEGESPDAPKPVVLTPEERQKLGITTAPAQAITYSDSSTAFGVVLSHDSIAQAVADLETASSAAHLSEVALTRGQKLAAGPGALGVDTLETLQKQKSADRAALSLARRKITAVVGVKFPWQGAEGDSGVLDSLASGEAKLVRATFPSRAFVGSTPKSLRLIPLEPGADTSSDIALTDTTAASGLTASPVWDAPQDPNLPGRSFFALLRNADIAEGSRFQVVPASPAGGVTGVLVPASAVVITSGQYWCYLEKNPGTFARVPIVIDKPLGAGYFVNDGVGVSEGDKVVTASAGLLLAREMNATTGPDE